MTSAIRRVPQGPPSPDRCGRPQSSLQLAARPTGARTAEEAPRVCVMVLDPACDLKEARIVRTVVRAI